MSKQEPKMAEYELAILLKAKLVKQAQRRMCQDLEVKVIAEVDKLL